MERQERVNLLLLKADDIRRLAMDELDATARRTNSFGSKDHRSGRDRVDLAYENEVQRCRGLDDAALERELSGQGSG